jgi:hypothetical protein
MKEKRDPMTLGFKSCSKCRNTYPACFGHFYRQKATSDGYTSWCRLCDREKSRIAKRMARLEGRIKSPTPEKSREYTRKHRIKDIQAARERDREYQKKRRKDPSYRMMCSVSSRIRHGIRNGKGSIRYLPYSVEELVSHMERQFSKGMSWDNYGSFWHIDHITPVSAFKIKERGCPEFNACWALSNLRPLLAEKNMSKGAKITHLI